MGMVGLERLDSRPRSTGARTAVLRNRRAHPRSRVVSGHAYLSTTGTYLKGISSEEIIGAVHRRQAPMTHASGGLEL